MLQAGKLASLEQLSVQVLLGPPDALGGLQTEVTYFILIPLWRKLNGKKNPTYKSVFG